MRIFFLLAARWGSQRAVLCNIYKFATFLLQNFVHYFVNKFPKNY